MPLIEVTHDATLTDSMLRNLGRALPDIVAAAVACPEEPWTGAPESGDIEIRFRQKGRFDIVGLNCVIEVRTKLFASRLTDKHVRAESIRAAAVAAEPGIGHLGVWLILHEGSWAQLQAIENCNSEQTGLPLMPRRGRRPHGSGSK